MPALEEVLARWPEEPREAALDLIDRYGLPEEYTASQLTWFESRDGWKRTSLTREMIRHDFPARHSDYLAQSINYKVPVDKVGALAAFDGSVVVDRTKGEVSVRCNGTSMNFVAINLVHDIVRGKLSSQEARRTYTRAYVALQRGEEPVYARGFQFVLPDEDTGDSDVRTVRSQAPRHAMVD